MKPTLVLLFNLFALSVFGQVKSYDYAYSKGMGIRVYSVAAKKEVMISKGVNPCISPDGTKLAYTAYLNGGVRTISVIDLTSKQTTILNTGSRNCYGPIWSPDGKYIAYNVFNEQVSEWSVALISSGNGSPRVLTGSLKQCSMPTWTADSKNVVVQDMEKVYIFDLKGNIAASYTISDISKGDGPSSNDRFIFTADKKKIVYSCFVDEPGFDEGPPSAVFVYDISTKAITRLSPKGYWGTDIWLKGDKVLFSGGKIKSTVTNVYTVDLNGKNLSLLFANCHEISAKY